MKHLLTRGAALAVALSLFHPAAQAQNIAWGPSQQINGDTDVATNGASVVAWAMGNGTASIPLNGVSFVSWKGNGAATGSTSPDGLSTLSAGAGDSITANGTAFGVAQPSFNNLSTNYQHLLASANYDGGTPMVLKLGGLTVGQMYEAQLWVNDSRSCCGARTELVDNQVVLDFDTSGAVNGGLGTFAVGAFIATGTNETITLAPSASGQIDMFQLRAISSAAAPVAGIPVITPSTIFVGSPIVLSVAAASAGTTTYQWQSDFGTGTFSNIGPASTNNTLALGTLNFTNGGSYYFQVIVSNSFGPSTSPFSLLTLNPAQIPSITTPLTATPSNSVYFAGQQVTLSAAFAGTQPISYQWLKGSAPIAGATNASLTLTNLQAAAAGSYSLNATNIIGATNTGAFAFTIGAAPAAGGILWGAASVISGDTDVATNGVTAVAYAANSGLTPALATVNGVVFSSFGAAGAAYTNENVVLTMVGGISLYTGFNDGGTYAPFDTLSTNYQRVLAGGNYGNTAADPGESPFYLTFNGLSAGVTYEFQYWVEDARTCCGGRYTTLSDLLGDAAAIGGYDNAGNVNGGFGSYITGTFTTSPTNPTSETIVIQGFEGSTTSGASQINAFQLRILSPAFPAYFETPITFNPSAQIYSGTPVNLGVTVLGPPGVTLSYQWQTDGGSGGAFTNLGSASASPGLLLSTAGVLSGSATFNYRVVVSGGGLSSTSSVSSLIINAAAAGGINWSASTPISGDSDVDNAGVTATAITASTTAYALSGALAVNGVSFTSFDAPGAGGSSGNVNLVSSAGIGYYTGYNNGGGAPFNTLSTNYQTVLTSGNYGNVDTWTMTFGGLSAGVNYELEFFVNDSRTCCEGRHETLTDPNGVSADLGPYNVQGEAGGMGSYIKGTFTANGPAEVVTIYGYSASTQLQAYQLRILSQTFPAYVNPATFSPSNVVYSGTPVTAVALAAGPTNTTLTYQWQTDGGSGGALTNVGAAGTNSAITVGTAGILATTVYNYQVIVTGAGLSSTSSVSSLTVNPGSIAIIDTEPNSVTNYQGTSANFSVVAEGTAPLKYQWQAGLSASGPFTNLVAGGGISGVTNATLTIAGISASSPNNFQVIISNPLGIITSGPPANLSVVSLPVVNPAVGGISWGPSASIQGDSDVSALGAPVGAFTANAAPVIVNNVNFTPFVPNGTAAITVGNVTLTSTATINNYTGFDDGGTFAPFDHLSASYKALVASGDWDDAPVPWTLVATNLIPGTNYLIQIWLQDARTCCGTRNETLVDSKGNTAVVGPYNNEGDVDGGLGSYIIGVFTQDSTKTMTLTLGGDANTASSQLNAFQIRELGVSTPPPVVTLNIATSTNNLLTINWPAGSLLQSTNVLGPWTTNTATSPYTFSSTNGPQKFYKVRVE